MTNQYFIPHAIFNSTALFNPYQYKPFSLIFDKDKKYEWNKKNLFITDEVGVGKTFEAGIILQQFFVHFLNISNGNTPSILIICPTKLTSQWKDEMWNNFQLDFDIFDGKSAIKQLSIVPSSLLSKLQSIGYYTYDALILDEAHYIRNKGDAIWTNNVVNTLQPTQAISRFR